VAFPVVLITFPVTPNISTPFFIFPEVKCSSTGNATDADVLSGKTYSNDGGASTGTMPDNGAFSLTCGDSDQGVAAGYYSGGTLTGDANLLSGNIKCGVTIFGVTGTLPPGCVSKTGQMTSYATGDDGAHQMGCDPAVTPLSGLNFGNYNRTSIPCSANFTDNGDGTVTDYQTGLIWLKNANCFGWGNWSSALSDCNSLASGSCGLSDGSSAGDWRLPNFNELRSLFDPGLSSPYLPAGHPFTAVQSGGYWSGTTYASYTYRAWYVGVHDGYVYYWGKTGTNYVWPVRGGN